MNINKKYSMGLLAVTMLLASCKETTKKEEMKEETTAASEKTVQTSLKDSDFDTKVDGKPVKLYWLKNGDLQMAMTNYGGRIVGLWTPDKNGKMTDVIIGRGSIKAYVDGPESYFGATIGRVGNRIAKGKFKVEGKEYSIKPNNNANALHGGENGFQDKVWDADQTNDYTLVLHYTSPDGEEGFPGELDAKVTYSLIDDHTLKIEYEATTDKTTVVNLTNHSYFNLNGEDSGSILDHKMQIFAEEFTPVDEGLIPIGELKKVEETPFDFTSPHTIGERIDMDNEQLKFGGGYDHNFVLGSQRGNGMNYAAKAVGDQSGILMQVYTEEPGVQFYTGNFMDSKNALKSGAKDDNRTAFCLETQHFPDAPNHPDFPSIELKPGDTYHTVTEYSFSTE
ncbi:MAG TPA: aldose epimerase family protein [Pricia sp.]|nr:aldose epimerase family protein [Pricia sp.]